MLRLKNYQAADCGASIEMESGNHSNGASPKSHTIRNNHRIRHWRATLGALPLILLLWLTGSVQAFAQTDISGDFTDQNFLAAVYAEINSNGTSINPGDPIYAYYLTGISYLRVSNKSIASLAGIEHFTDLRYLYCDQNNLTTINISGLTLLRVLECYANQLTELDVTGLNLSSLICSTNQLTELDVTGLNDLTLLNCSNNYLQTDPTGYTSAVTIYTFSPQNQLITGISVSPSATTVNKGATETFTATATAAINVPASLKTVTWSVSGHSSASTNINPTSGELTVGADETATSLAVTATTTYIQSGITPAAGTANVTVGAAQPPTVTGVTVTPATVSVPKGGNQQFTAQVNGTGSPSQSVTWSITSTVASGTNISAGGLLTIDAAETATNITVTATSVEDNNFAGTATVTVTTAPTPTVTGVTVTPAAVQVQIGATQQFAATVNGTNNPSQNVTWSITGESSTNTDIDGTGLLTVASDETDGGTITVIATSVENSAFSDSATVTVSATAPTPTVTGVTVTPASVQVQIGTTKQFSATVNGTNNPSQNVTWSITGESSTNTDIDGNGLLTVASDETDGGTITVIATSVENSAFSDSATVTVSATAPSTVTGVTVNPVTVSVPTGGTQQFTAQVNGTGSPSQSVTWSITSTVASGTNISAGGLLTIDATETAPTITVKATSVADPAFSNTATVTVTSAASPVITTPPGALMGGTVGTAYSDTIVATNSPTGWAVSTGSLPPGLNLDNYGIISGNPGTAGTYNFDVTATNGSGTSAPVSFSIIIDPITFLLSPVITTHSGALMSGTVGTAYSDTIVAANTPTSWAVSTGSLPSGLNLDNYGIISGNPGTAGTYNFDVTATNGGGTSAPVSFSIFIASAPTLPSVTNIGGSATVTYDGDSINLSALSGLFTIDPNAGAPTYSIETGGTGIGSMFDDTTLTVTAAGTFTIGLITAATATHQAGALETATLTVNKAAQAAPTGLTATNESGASLNDGKISGVTTAMQYRLLAVLAPPYTTCPADTILNLAPGTYEVRYAENALYEASNAIQVTVAAYSATIAITTLPASVPGGTTGTPYSYTLAASGSPTPTWAVDNSTPLPAGLALSLSGVLSGTPSAAGTFTFDVIASNGVAVNDTVTFTIAIADGTPPSFTGTGTANRTSDVAATIIFTTDEAGTAYYLVLPGGTTPAPTSAEVIAGTYTGGAASVVSANSTSVPAGAASVPVILAAGAMDVYVVVEDAAGNISTTMLTFSLTAIVPSTTPSGSTNTGGSRTGGTTGAAPSIKTTADAITGGVTGTAYRITLTATGSPTPTWSVTSGNLPAGLTISAAGVISGTPTVAGTYTFTVTATNGIGSGSSRTFTITIDASTVGIEEVGSAKIWASGGKLYIICRDVARYVSTVQIYNISGMLVKTINVPASEMTVDLPAGIYVVRFGDMVVKVFI